MIEIEKLNSKTIHQPAFSMDPSNSSTPNNGGEPSNDPGCTGNGSTGNSEPSNDPSESPIIDSNSGVSIKDLKPGDRFYGSIITNIGNKKHQIIDIFTVLDNSTPAKVKVANGKGPGVNGLSTSRCAIKLKSLKNLQETLKKQEEEKENEEKIKESLELAKKLEESSIDFASLEPEEKLYNTIKADIKNIWMVGPAGCGKSTIARNTASKLELPYLCISCGIGTSATEFLGYKYPSREATKFSEYYSKPSIILIDEFTALDPAVAQVCNAALANGEIETTTGLVRRHKDCIIIATSNTFGNGADRQYVANNQLDASTIDRFIGGIINVEYSSRYESTYDYEVVEYVNHLRSVIKINDIRRLASTRMIQAGHTLKLNLFKNWKDLLIVNWTDTEKKIVKEYFDFLALTASKMSIVSDKKATKEEDLNELKCKLKSQLSYLYGNAA